jgi:hypothetical protein
MPHYFFDIKNGHRLVDPSGSNCKNDTAAIEKANVLANIPPTSWFTMLVQTSVR